MPWKSFEDSVRHTVTDYVGVRRTGEGLKLAIETLLALAKQEDNLQADDLHGVMRTHELKSIRLNAEIMATAAVARNETRTRSAHRRLDYPEPDNENWRKFIVVETAAPTVVPRCRPSTRTCRLPRPSRAARNPRQPRGWDMPPAT